MKLSAQEKIKRLKAMREYILDSNNLGVRGLCDVYERLYTPGSKQYMLDTHIPELHKKRDPFRSGLYWWWPWMYINKKQDAEHAQAVEMRIEAIDRTIRDLQSK